MQLLMNEEIRFEDTSSFREDYEGIEIELGHVPSYDEEQESEVVAFS